MALKFDPGWAIVLLALAAATLAGALAVARSKPGGRSMRQVLTEDDKGFRAPVASEAGGSLFAAFVVGTILFSAVPKAATPILVASSLLFVASVLIYAMEKGTVAHSSRSKRSSSFSDSIGLTLSGAGIMSGDDLAKMMMRHAAPCLRCGTTIAFEQGASLAMDRGIHAKVVMCGSCNSIYEVEIGPQGMRLTTDVTSKYKD